MLIIVVHTINKLITPLHCDILWYVRLHWVFQVRKAKKIFSIVQRAYHVFYYQCYLLFAVAAAAALFIYVNVHKVCAAPKISERSVSVSVKFNNVTIWLFLNDMTHSNNSPDPWTIVCTHSLTDERYTHRPRFTMWERKLKLKAERECDLLLIQRNTEQFTFVSFPRVEVFLLLLLLLQSWVECVYVCTAGYYRPYLKSPMCVVNCCKWLFLVVL